MNRILEEWTTRNEDIIVRQSASGNGALLIKVTSVTAKYCQT